MTIGLGADHGGYILKEYIKNKLNEKEINYKDYGTNSEERTDYPVYAEKVAKGIQNKEIDLGILICKSGHGMVIAANKFKGVYASVAETPESIVRGKGDDNLNVCVISALNQTENSAMQIVDAFIETEFKTGRYVDRFEMVKTFENANFKEENK